jgi:hypothetical protein|tara:strand:+ start:75 stop:383 length:309 start_codon:yes stop_codon:yes gene_type:complete
MDTIPFSIFYIGIPITLISIYIIWNLLRKVERLEDELNTSEDLIESTFKDFDEAYTKLTKIDRMGSFEADDESGFIFDKIKSIIEQLNNQYNPYGEEKKEEK